MSTMKNIYQGNVNINILVEYKWSIKRDIGEWNVHIEENN